jgi:hypothetical protein
MDMTESGISRKALIYERHGNFWQNPLFSHHARSCFSVHPWFINEYL